MFEKLRPFASIAKSLRILVELYELDLGSRTPPIYRLTEKPSRHDTEVTYMDDRPVDPRVAEFADVDTDDWQ